MGSSDTEGTLGAKISILGFNCQEGEYYVGLRVVEGRGDGLCHIRATNSAARRSNVFAKA